VKTRRHIIQDHGERQRSRQRRQRPVRDKLVGECQFLRVGTIEANGWRKPADGPPQARSLHHNAGCRSFRLWCGRLACAENVETSEPTLSDADGSQPIRWEPFTDNRNPRIQRRRPPWDINHALKGNFVYDLPLVNGKRLNYRPLRRLLEGWGSSGILLWQTGRPFGVHSTRGGVNRSGYGGTPRTQRGLRAVIWNLRISDHGYHGS
jgi:hypothetical protein